MRIHGVALLLAAASISVSCTVEVTSRPGDPPAAAAPIAPGAPPAAYKVGETVAYHDRWRVTLVKWEEQPAPEYFPPRSGMRYVTVVMRFENGTPRGRTPSALLDFKLEDSAGIRRTAQLVVDRDDALESAELAPGATLVGSITFEAPVGDQRLRLIYDPLLSLRRPVVFALD